MDRVPLALSFLLSHSQMYGWSSSPHSCSFTLSQNIFKTRFLNKTGIVKHKYPQEGEKQNIEKVVDWIDPIYDSFYTASDALHL